MLLFKMARSRRGGMMACWELTHWGRATIICVSEIIIIGSDNGLSPGRRQAIIWTNVGILLIGPMGINFSEILIEINTFSFKKMHLKMSSAKWRLFRLGLNVLIASSVDHHAHVLIKWRIMCEGLNRPISQIPQWIRTKSHHAPSCNRIVTKCCICGYESGALWDLWIRSICCGLLPMDIYHYGTKLIMLISKSVINLYSAQHGVDPADDNSKNVLFSWLKTTQYRKYFYKVAF